MRVITVDGPKHLDVGIYARLLAAKLGLRCIGKSGGAIPIQGAVVIRGGDFFRNEAIKLFLCDDKATYAPADAWQYDVSRHATPEEAVACLARLCACEYVQPDAMPARIVA